MWRSSDASALMRPFLRRVFLSGDSLRALRFLILGVLLLLFLAMVPGISAPVIWRCFFPRARRMAPVAVVSVRGP